jgi:hypothetical protein
MQMHLRISSIPRRTAIRFFRRDHSSESTDEIKRWRSLNMKLKTSFLLKLLFSDVQQSLLQSMLQGEAQRTSQRREHDPLLSINPIFSTVSVRAGNSPAWNTYNHSYSRLYKPLEQRLQHLKSR